MGISDNLVKIRNKQDISQQEVADFLGIGLRTYVDWESGKTDVKCSYIPKLTEYLQIEANDLFPKKPGEIVINQNNHHKDNKDNSINGVILLITDKEVVDNIVDVVKKKFEKQ